MRPPLRGRLLSCVCVVVALGHMGWAAPRAAALAVAIARDAAPAAPAPAPPHPLCPGPVPVSAFHRPPLHLPARAPGFPSPHTRHPAMSHRPALVPCCWFASVFARAPLLGLGKPPGLDGAPGLLPLGTPSSLPSDREEPPLALPAVRGATSSRRRRAVAHGCLDEIRGRKFVAADSADAKTDGFGGSLPRKRRLRRRSMNHVCFFVPEPADYRNH